MEKKIPNLQVRLPLGLVQQNVNVMRVSAGNSTAVLRCNTANSSLTIDGKFEIMNKRIGSVRNWKLITFNPALHLHKPLWVMPGEPYISIYELILKQELKRLPLCKLIINGF